ncbi:MAG: SAM-dependent chlorinase/fluorinase [Candidatus Hydrogenedentes bacterium]|nr:SAM-dependent chlorinase/fluorinase [Candidatus Hydrogenedentota bacterium]
MIKRIVLVFLVLAVSTIAHGAAKPNGLVILATDYGADSIYVGEIKGAIYTKFPQARVDSITNSIPPYDIVTGAYTLLESTGMYPSGTTFVCIVDPGVGTPRKPIVLETNDGQRYVGPDNGILSLVADKYGVAEIRECANPELWRAGDVSHTFHGRDIFGPVAAALASGAPMDKVGPKLESLTKLDTTPSTVEGDTVHGSVIRVDDYGNIVTNIPAENLAKAKIKKGDTLDVAIGKAHFTAPLVSTYGDAPKGQRLVNIQSAGFVECAVNQGSLVKETGEGVKARVSIVKKP